MVRTREFTHKEEEKLVHLLFFIFGFGIMAWVPRFPDLKQNLGLSNGEFGSILTTGSVGAFIGLLTIGHLVQKWGVFKVAVPATAIVYGSLTLAVNVSSPILFIFCNIAIAFGITAQHVSFNTHGFALQERSGFQTVTTTAGYWSAGALITAILSGFLASRVDFTLHMSTVAILAGALSIFLLFQLRPILVRANRRESADLRIRDIFTKFHLDWPISIALSFAIYLEFAIGDWGTIFTEEQFNIDRDIAAVPYIVFTIFMITGRLWGIKRLDQSKIVSTARKLTLTAGIGFGVCIALAVNLPEHLKWVSFAFVILGFALAGAGSSILGPTITRAANRRSPHPPSVVVGQLGVTNNILTTIMKWTVAGIIGFTGSMSIALMLPAVLIIFSALFMRVLATE